MRFAGDPARAGAVRGVVRDARRRDGDRPRPAAPARRPDAAGHPDRARLRAQRPESAGRRGHRCRRSPSRRSCPLVLYLLSIPFGAGAFGLGDVKLLVGVGLMGGGIRAFTGLVSGLFAGRARARGPGRRPAGDDEELRPVRPVPDLRGGLGDLRPGLGRVADAVVATASWTAADRCRADRWGPVWSGVGRWDQSTGSARNRSLQRVGWTPPGMMPDKPVSSWVACPIRAAKSPARLAVMRAPRDRSAAEHNGVCSHDDDAHVMPPHHAVRGWSTSRPSAPAGSGGSPSLLLVPLLFGVLGVPAVNRRRPSTPTSSPTRRRSRPRSPSRSRTRRPQVAQINALQSDLSRQIAATKRELTGSTPTSPPSASRSTQMVVQIEVVKKQYFALVAQAPAARQPARQRRSKQRSCKRSELGTTKAELRRADPDGLRHRPDDRCSRRSCRAAPSPTSSPRSATSTTSPSRTRRSPSRSSTTRRRSPPSTPRS